MSMRFSCRTGSSAAAIAGLLLLAGIACGAQPERSLAGIDAELGSQGVWQGIVVTPEGLGVPGAPLELRKGIDQRTAFFTVTDKDGRFRFEGVQPGAYSLRCGSDVRICRLWQSGTAPPSAERGTLIVVGDGVARGKLYDWAASYPVLTYVGIATAIAVPIAVIGTAQTKSPASP